MPIFTLTDEIKAIAKEAFTDLILELHKTCKLVYPPKMTRCTNCVADQIGRKSSNIWSHGGPIPFPMGAVCPMCNGDGYQAEEQYDLVKFLVNEDLKSFYKANMPPGFNFPDGTIQTKGFMRDMPKVMRCDYMIKHIEIESYRTMRYELLGEPLSPGNIIQAEFFVATWQRIA